MIENNRGNFFFKILFSKSPPMNTLLPSKIYGVLIKFFIDKEKIVILITKSHLFLLKEILPE